MAPLLLLAVTLALSVRADLLGVDVSTAVSVTAATCMAAANISVGIARAWHSTGTFDPAAVGSVAAFRAAKFAVADVYMFPCSFRDAQTQVNELIGNLSAANVDYGRIWFDVETNPSRNCEWSTNTSRNCAYMTDLVTAAAASGKKWGVYSSIHMWTTLMTSASQPRGCAVGGDLPLWYPHYQSPPQPNFGDWTPFGGWDTPTIKQYNDGPDLCGVGADRNWMPAQPGSAGA